VARLTRSSQALKSARRPLVVTKSITPNQRVRILLIASLFALCISCQACADLQTEISTLPSPTATSATPTPPSPTPPATTGRVFDLTPLSTSNLITFIQIALTIIQIIVVALGFYFSYHSLQAARASADTAAKNATAQLVSQLVSQGRDLQYKYIQTFMEAGHDAEKQSAFRGMILAYYSSCFELRRILQFPQELAVLLDDELRRLIQQPDGLMKARWDALKNGFSEAFRNHVERLLNR
jgi:hypothetical protein